MLTYESVDRSVCVQMCSFLIVLSDYSQANSHQCSTHDTTINSLAHLPIFDRITRVGDSRVWKHVVINHQFFLPLIHRYQLNSRRARFVTMHPFMTTSSASYYLNGNTRLDQHQEIYQSTSSSQLHRQLKGEEYSIKNRLRSFEDDRRFVEEITHAYPSLSIHANLSCGIWYLNASVTERASDPCYFKSTDGHPHHWKFSDTRLNVHIIKALVTQTTKSTPVSDSDSSAPSSSKQCSGALIIDSTRKGKRFPDSFSRTIPIWCTVWNRAIHQWRQLNRIEIKPATPATTDDSISTTSTTADPSPSDVVPPLVPSSTFVDWDLDLHMPTWISQMEQRQIEERLPAFVTTLLNSKVDFEPIARGLLKPLRCLWMDRSSSGWEHGDRDFHRQFYIIPTSV